MAKVGIELLGRNNKESSTYDQVGTAISTKFKLKLRAPKLIGNQPSNLVQIVSVVIESGQADKQINRQTDGHTSGLERPIHNLFILI